MNKIINKIVTSLQIMVSKISTPENHLKVIHTDINDYQLLVLGNEDVGRQIHYLKRYEKVETDFLIKKIKSNSICIDIGANVGYFTMLMAKVAKTGSVHVFEPIVLNASLLRASAELNGFTNIYLNQSVVSNSEESVIFSQSSDSAYSSIINTDRKPLVKTFSVPSTTLDAYLDREKISKVDIIKVDVEGAEELVISGAAKLLSDEKRKPNLIMMELFDENLFAFGSSLNSIMNKLNNYGYKAFIIDENGKKMPFSIDMKSKFYNIFFLSA